MIAGDRQQLKRLVDAGTRTRLERERPGGKRCRGCSGTLDRYTVGCQTCRDRCNHRALRARKAAA